jgi:type IV pilus assembly protein PilM
MFRLQRSQIHPIGLDIGRDAIKMLQLEVVGESLAAVAGAIQGFPSEARLQPQSRLALLPEMIRQMLRQNPFQGRTVAAALPREFIHCKNIRLPLMPAEELDPAVKYEARSIFPFDTEDAQVHCMPAGEVRQGNDVLQEVIVLAARNQDINGFVEQLHACGVVIGSLDVEACALFRSVERFTRRREDEAEVHVLVDVGLGSTQVVIGKGREISFLKTIDIGGIQFQEAISRKLSISIDEAQALRRRLAENGDAAGEKKDPVRQHIFDATRSVMEQLGRELSLCLRYQSVTFRGQRPTRLRLMGGEGADTHLQEVLTSILTIPIEAPRPLYSIDSSKLKSLQRQTAMGEWALVLGLALRQTTGRFRPRDGRPRGGSAPSEVVAFTPADPNTADGRASALDPISEQVAALAASANANGGRGAGPREGGALPYRPHGVPNDRSLGHRQEAPNA